MGYSIWIKGEEVPVSEEVYHTYWQGMRKERYFTESDIHNKTYSYDALDTEEMIGSDLFCDAGRPPVEEQVIFQIEKQALSAACQQLDEQERDLIRRIYYYNESLRKIARQKKTPASTLQYRHKKVLQKLRNYLLKNGGNYYE